MPPVVEEADLVIEPSGVARNATAFRPARPKGGKPGLANLVP